MDWENSKFKQLNQYHAQAMFEEHTLPPQRSNILTLIWTYLVKQDGTKKSQYVCNRNPCCKGRITLGHTYTAALDQPWYDRLGISQHFTIILHMM